MFSDACGRVVGRILAVVLASVGVVVGTGSSAAASCAPPTITVNRTSVHAGDVVELTGFYLGSCNDTGGSANRMKHIELRVVQDATDVQDTAQVALTVKPGASADPQTLTVTKGSLDEPSARRTSKRTWSILGSIGFIAIAVVLVMLVRRRRQPRTGART